MTTLASKLKLLPRPAADNSRDQSRQSDLGGAASGQKTATGHPETTRANAKKPLAVQRLPTTAPGKTAIEAIHAHSVVDHLAVNGKWSDSVSTRPVTRAIQPRAGPKHPPGFPNRRSGSQGGTLTGAELRRLSRLITSQGVQR